MNWLDAVIILIMLSFLFWGLVKGLILIFFFFFWLAVGTKLAWTYYLPLSGRLGFIQNAMAMKVVAFALILLAVLIVSWIVGALLRKLVNLVSLGFFDRLGGAVLGLGLGVFFSVVLVAVLLRFPLFDLSETVFHSKLAVFLMEWLAFFFSLLPGDLGQVPPVTAFLW